MKKNRSCVWTPNDVDDYWETGRCESYCFINDGPKENNYRFCPGCGKPIKEKREVDA